jgi:hypothetical protein
VRKKTLARVLHRDLVKLIEIVTTNDSIIRDAYNTEEVIELRILHDKLPNDDSPIDDDLFATD